MKDVDLIQVVSKGVTETIDDLVLQRIIKITEDAKIKNEEMLRFQLNRCEFSGRQRVFFDSEDDEDKEDVEVCMFCRKPVNEVVYAYQYATNGGEIKQLYCLESEGEEIPQTH